MISMQNKNTNEDLAERNVVKSNAIIQNARFELPTQEQKIIAYIRKNKKSLHIFVQK